MLIISALNIRSVSMSKDLTISNIERQNVLNNRLAVDAIIAKIEMPGMFF